MSNALLTEHMLKQEAARIWSEYAPGYEAEFKFHLGYTPGTDESKIKLTFRNKYIDFIPHPSDLLMSLNDFSERILRPMVNALAQSTNLVHPLRDLASKIEALAKEHSSYSQAQKIVQNCVDHLSAVARTYEQNVITVACICGWRGPVPRGVVKNCPTCGALFQAWPVL